MNSAATVEPNAPPLEAACAHCGQPASSTCDAGQPAFCCGGCRAAYAWIQGSGLGEYYALREQTGGGQAGAVLATGSRPQEQWDSPELLGASAPRPLGGGGCSGFDAAVDGLHCAACVWLIERVSQMTPGWQSARVNLSRGTVSIAYDPARIRPAEIARRLASIGYTLLPLGEGARIDSRAGERGLLIRIAVAGFCAANAMWIAVALYAGRFSGMEPQWVWLLQSAGNLLGIFAVLVPGQLFFRSAVAAARARVPHMDLPVALGLAGGLVNMLYSLARGVEGYFDSMAVLVFLLLVGRWLQNRGTLRAADQVDRLLRLGPAVVEKVIGTATLACRVETLALGDVVRVKAGGAIPVDGRVVAGASAVDRSLLTGESIPQEVARGDTVEAGTVNLAAPIDIEVTAVGEATQLGKLSQLTSMAAAQRPAWVQFADRLGRWFVWAVLLLAALTAVVHFPAEGWGAGRHVLAVLIVACPCALAMATPLALACAVGQLSKRSVLIRSIDALSRLAKPGTIWFDKTGTLTAGRMRVVAYLGDRRHLAAAAVLESCCQHPIASAIVEYARLEHPAANAQGPDAVAFGDGWRSTVQVVGGGGVSGCLRGQVYCVGSMRWLLERGIEVPLELRNEYQRLCGEGSSAVLVACENRAELLLALADPLREESVEAVRTLRGRGWDVGILSGDHPAVVRSVAAVAGIESSRAFGGLSPEDKYRRVAERANLAGEGGGRRCVVMVGDGANDVAALAAADVGIAVRGGASASMQAAPVYIAGGSLRDVVRLIDAAGRTERMLRRNLLLSGCYNALAAGLAAAGWMDPLIAAILMPVSSVSVLSATLGTRLVDSD